MESRPERLLAERERRFRRQPELRVQDEEQAARFIDEVGLCVLFPVQRMELPSLWEAINGCSRPLPRHHDDDALGKAWRWKDTLPARGRVYYGKLLRGKATLLTLDLLPSFYALSPNYGGAEDYLQEYEAGRLSREARAICDVLLERGALPTGDLRRLAHLSSRSQKYRFERAIAELQQKLMLAKVDTADAGPWHYSYVYDLFVRAYPVQVEAARFLTPRRAQGTILRWYVHTAVMASPAYLCWLFGWRQDAVDRAAADLVEAGELTLTTIAGWEGQYLLDPCPS
jgi:hypothetical protein